MSKQANDGQKWIFILLGVFLLLFLSRVLFRLVWIFLLIGLVIVLYFGMMALLKWYRNKKFQKTTEGQIHARISYCQEQTQKNELEIEDIKQSISELEKKLVGSSKIDSQNTEETRRLIEAFQGELKLRNTKLSFFQTCQIKLQTMLNNYGYAKDLEAQKQKLRKLQENHFEELAQMEELKTEVEMDVLYLDTIERLSQRILESTNPNDAEQVRMELEVMTKDLKDFDRNS